MAKQTPPPGKELLRPITLTYIMEAHIWSVTTFAGNEKIILTWPVPQTTNASPLWLCFSEIRLTSASNTKRLKLSRTGSFPLLRTNLKLFSDKISENPPHSLTTSKVKSKKTCNTSKKKYKTGFFTYDTSNPSWWNLTFDILLSKTYYVNISIKTSNYWFDYGSTK